MDLSVSCLRKVKGLKYDVIILSWEATGPHSLHLPYLTDCILPHDIVAEAAGMTLTRSEVRRMVMPPIPFGVHNPGRRELPFCVHTRYAAQQTIPEDIISPLYVQGFRELVILCRHRGNNFKGMIRDFAFEYPDFLIAAANWSEMVFPKGYSETEVDDRVGESETAVITYYHPESVNLAEAGDGRSKPFATTLLNEKIAWMPCHQDKTTVDSEAGDPRKATAKKGKRCVKSVVKKLTRPLKEMVKHGLYE